LEAPALHTLRLIARQPWRHCVTSLRWAHWLASSLKLAARWPVSGCWPSCIDGVKWRHISVVAIRSPFCRSRPLYCAWLSGEDLSRYSNKIESIGLSKCPYKRYLTKKVMSEQETFCRAWPITWRKNSWHGYDMKKLRHCHPMYSTHILQIGLSSMYEFCAAYTNANDNSTSLDMHSVSNPLSFLDFFTIRLVHCNSAF